MTSANRLPAAFSDLEPFVANWAKPTTNERLATRCASTMDEIRAFYDATIGRAEAALDYLDQLDIHNLPDDAACLMQLLLGLVQASIAVEIQGQPLPFRTSAPLGVSLVSGAAPFGAAG